MGKFLRNAKVFMLLLSGITLMGCKTSQKVSTQSVQTPTKTYTAAELQVDDLFLQGVIQKELGNNSEAKDLLERVLEKTNGKYAPAHYYLADVCFQNKDFTSVLQHADAAMEQAPDNIWYQLQTAGHYQQLSQYDKASAVYAGIVKKYPKKEPYYFEWANCLLAKRDYDGAIKVMDKYEDYFGINDAVSMQKRNLYLGLGKTDKAVQEVEKLQKAFPSETKYSAISAETFMSRKNYAKAKEYYDQILKYNPEDPYIHISLANLYQQIGDPQAGYSELKNGFANPNLDPKTKLSLLDAFYNVEKITPPEQQQIDTLMDILLVAHQTDAEAFALVGSVLFNLQRLEQAEHILSIALEKGNTSYRLYEQLIFIASLKQGSEEQLIKNCNDAIEHYPEQPVPYLFKGNVLVNTMKNYEQGIETLEAGLNWVVGNAVLESDFCSTLGEAYYRQNKYALSDRNFRKAILLNPENYVVKNNFAYYLSQRGESLSEARTLIEFVLKKYPQEGVFLDTYAWVLFKQGECEKAKEIMQPIMQHGNVSGEQMQHYGEILSKCGDKEQAKVFFQKAMEKKITEGMPSSHL